MLLLLKTSKASVYRRGPGEWLDGYYEKGKISKFEIDCSVQPMAGKSLDQAPEGSSTRNSMTIWTETQLEVNDVVDIDGIKYEVQAVQDWKHYCIPHCRAVLAEMDDQNEPV